VHIKGSLVDEVQHAVVVVWNWSAKLVHILRRFEFKVANIGGLEAKGKVLGYCAVIAVLRFGDTSAEDFVILEGLEAHRVGGLEDW
jgi:hypothetical protein